MGDLGPRSFCSYLNLVLPHVALCGVARPFLLGNVSNKFFQWHWPLRVLTRSLL